MLGTIEQWSALCLTKKDMVDERQSLRKELVHMKPLSETTFETQSGLKRIEAYECNIADFDEPISVLVTSAFVGNYDKVHGTMMHALGKQGINVKKLSRDPAIDLRKPAGVWLSAPTKAKGGLQAERIACLELLPQSPHQSSRITQADLILKLRALFQMLDLADTAGMDISTVALPMLGTGNQQIPLDLILPPLITECQGFLKRNPAAKRIVLFERNHDKALEMARVLEGSYALQQASSPQQQPDPAAERPLAFISYASGDFDVAVDLASKLEDRGIATWYAPRDILVGDYASSIVGAITRCTHFVVIISKNSMKSEHVLNEVSLAFEELSRSMRLMPLIIDSEEMTPALLYYLNRQQWAEAKNPPLEARLAEFSERVAKARK